MSASWSLLSWFGSQVTFNEKIAMEITCRHEAVKRF